MSKLNSILQRLIIVSASDSDDARRRKNLNILLIGLGCLLIVIILIAIFVLVSTSRDRAGNSLIVLGSAFMLASIIVVYSINRYWSGVVSATLFLLLLYVAICFSDTPQQLSTGRSLFVFVIPIVMASLILQPGATFIFAALSSIIIGIFSTSQGKLPNSPAITGYFLIAFVSWLSARSLEQTLGSLREVNENLDKLVEQKTQELSQSLSRELVLSGRNQAILNSIADGVIAFDTNNIAILANPALGSLIETSYQNLIGDDIDKFLNSENLSASSARMIKELINRPKEATTIGVRVPWGSRTLSTSIAHVQDEEKNTIGTVAVFHDITREAELEQMKNTFIAIVSHELRTPLSAILGYAEMLKEGVYGQINEKQLNVSARIMTNTERLLDIVNDLLDQAQIEAGKLKILMVPCKPAELLNNLRDVMDRIVTDKGIELIAKLDPNMPTTITGDPQRLQQVMVNLVNNAVKFTERNGVVSLTVGPINESNWKIQVSDTGAGIPKEAQEYIFETFRQADAADTRQHGGVGLGLSIVKQLTELMNGNITVESEIGKGSTFIVTLPLVVP